MTIIAEQPQIPAHLPQDQISYIRNMGKKLSTEELEYRLNIFFMPLPLDKKSTLISSKEGHQENIK